jgi:hypothetical protein
LVEGSIPSGHTSQLDGDFQSIDAISRYLVPTKKRVPRSFFQLLAEGFNLTDSRLELHNLVLAPVAGDLSTAL